jgi:CBS domain-containing protein
MMATAADIMVRDVIAVRPEATVREAAQSMLDNRISGLPVIDAAGKLVGLVTEGDLMRRHEIGTEGRRPWWLLFTSPEKVAEEFVKSHARTVADVMTRDLVTVNEDAPIGEVAAVLEKRHVKRVPVLRDGEVVGVVSRANLLRAFAAFSPASISDTPASDQEIAERVNAQLRAQPWGMPWLVSVTVADGIVSLWGTVSSEDERRTLRVAAEATPGVREVRDNLVVRAVPLGAE